MNSISYYLNDILTPKLQKYGVSELFLKYTIDTIYTQMISLLRHWDDAAFRKTVLLIGLEEGIFYKPLNKIDVNCFVVVTIRNSPIEILQSTIYSQSGLTAALNSNDIKEITSEAIQYFNKQNFFKISSQVKLNSKYDFYLDIAKKCPVAWNALKFIALNNNVSYDYTKIKSAVPYYLKDLDYNSESTSELNKFKTVKYNGYSAKIEPTLKGLLKQLSYEENGIFFVESFKSVTRNFTKLIEILEFLLTRNLVFVSTNYYLENGHVEKRINLLRPAHNLYEMKQNMTNTFGLSFKHQSVFEHYAEKFK